MATKEDIPQMVKDGLSDAEIAELVGVAKSYVPKLRMSMGVRRGPRNPGLSKATIKRIKELSAEPNGWPPSEIVKTLGVTYDAVHRHAGTRIPGAEWRNVAKWCRLNHPRLFSELMDSSPRGGAA